MTLGKPGDGKRGDPSPSYPELSRGLNSPPFSWIDPLFRCCYPAGRHRALPPYVLTRRVMRCGQFGSVHVIRASSATIGAEFAFHLCPEIESGTRRTLR
jgi:hypothetical protein